MATIRETLVDDFGALSAQIAELEAKKDAIRKQIVAFGVGAYEGIYYRATVSKSERETLDMKAVREHLSHQFITAHTKVTEVVTVKGSVRNNIAVAA